MIFFKKGLKPILKKIIKICISILKAPRDHNSFEMALLRLLFHI